MQSKEIQSNKENNSNTPKQLKNARKSFGSLRQLLNTSESFQISEQGGLNDKFSEYIEYVRSIETTNETLKNEKARLIDCYENEIYTMKNTYGEEIDCLRKALNDVSSSKSALMLTKDNLLEEKEKLNASLASQTKCYTLLKKEFSVLEENFNNVRTKIEQYDTLKEEHDNLLTDYNSNLKILKIEVSKRAELENQVISLTEELEFNKKLNRNAKANISDDSLLAKQASMQNTEMLIAEKVEDIKMELSENYEQYKIDLEEMYEQKYENLRQISENSASKCSSLYSEVKTLNRKIENLKNEIFEKDNHIKNLTNRIATHDETVVKLNMEHEKYVQYIMEDNLAIKKTLESKIIELSDIKKEKAAIEKELDMFRRLLEGEKSRCNINEASVPKRRKLNDSSPQETNHSLTAWTNERVKMFCDEQYDGRYIQLLNDSSENVDLNEWKVEIKGENFQDTYVFPPRILKPGAFLKVWKVNENVVEDEENTVMNVELPVSSFLFCKLINDMDGDEASFEWKKVVTKRKFLKAQTKKHDNQKECILM